MRQQSTGGRRDSKKKNFKTNRRRPLRPKSCRFCTERLKAIDFRDTVRLTKFTSERGKILPRRISGTCAAHQRQLARAVKRTRTVALMPYIGVAA